MKRIILHAFQWRLNDIAASMEQIADCGFNAIQISPITPTKDEDNGKFWMLYQPINFTVGNKQIGSRNDLIRLCSKAREYGIDIIADVVLRHLAGADDGSLNTNPKDDSTLTSNPDYWLPKVSTEDYDNRAAVTESCFGLPALNYYNHDVQDRYITYLDDLIACGVSSFRVDMGKHFALPSEGCDFWTRVFGRYNHRFNYAENLDCSTELHDRYCEYVGICSNTPCSDENKFVAFFETHDTYHTFYSTTHMTDADRLSKWEWTLGANQNALWFSRPDDNLTLSRELSEINLAARNQANADKQLQGSAY